MDPTVSQLMDKGRTLEDNLELQRLIRLNVNATDDDGWTALHLAARYGHYEIAKYILEQPDVLPNISALNSGCPLRLACTNSGRRVVKLLLDDPRVDVNLMSEVGYPPLYEAIRWQNEPIIQLFLVHAHNLDLSQEFVVENGGENITHTVIGHLANTIADTSKRVERRRAEVSKPGLASPSIYKIHHLSCNKELQKCERIHTLLVDYEANRNLVRHKLRLEEEYPDAYSHHLYALIIFICDGLLKIKSGGHRQQNRDVLRFYGITKRLPMELQMMLCNRVQEFGRDYIKVKFTQPSKDPEPYVRSSEYTGKSLGDRIRLKDSEAAFQHLGQLCQLMPLPKE